MIAAHGIQSAAWVLVALPAFSAAVLLLLGRRVGAVAGGKIFSNHRSSHVGVQLLVGDAIAVVLYGSIIGMLSVF